eukprot:364743-Chlamydomonas_euryale.AAC.85
MVLSDLLTVPVMRRKWPSCALMKGVSSLSVSPVQPSCKMDTCQKTFDWSFHIQFCVCVGYPRVDRFLLIEDGVGDPPFPM